MTTLYHQERGKGQNVVFIHGFCETSEIWSDIAHPLSKEIHIYLLDLPGFGKSASLSGSFSIDDVALEVWHWIDRNTISNPVIIGHSLGGYVALAMAAQRPAQMGSFGLFHSTALADSPEKKENRNKVVAFVLEHGTDPFIDTFVPGLFYNKVHPAMERADAICRQTKKETLISYTQAMRDRPDRQEVLKTFTKPILFLAGQKDSVIPVESLDFQCGLTKKGTLEVLPEVGHMGMLEAPQSSIAAIRKFLK